MASDTAIAVAVVIPVAAGRRWRGRGPPAPGTWSEVGGSFGRDRVRCRHRRGAGPECRGHPGRRAHPPADSGRHRTDGRSRGAGGRACPRGGATRGSLLPQPARKGPRASGRLPGLGTQPRQDRRRDVGRPRGGAHPGRRRRRSHRRPARRPPSAGQSRRDRRARTLSLTVLRLGSRRHAVAGDGRRPWVPGRRRGAGGRTGRSRQC